jgi:hypothetical protein
MPCRWFYDAFDAKKLVKVADESEKALDELERDARRAGIKIPTKREKQRANRYCRCRCK